MGTERFVGCELAFENTRGWPTLRHPLALSVVLLFASTAAVAQAPALGAGAFSVSAKPKTLADVARDRKLGKKGVAGGTLSVAGASGMPAMAPAASGQGASSSDADTELQRAIRNGEWVDRNIHYNERIRQDARRDWDAAAERCRQTPGCTPVYRENVAPEKLMTGKEAARALQKKLGPGADTPGR